jgi:anti-anti-sigma regulatory factor
MSTPSQNQTPGPAATTTATESPQQEPFVIERFGDIAIITPSPIAGKMPENLMEWAAQLVLGPLRADPPAGLIFDLSKVDYVGSVFNSFLLRCHKRVKEHGSEVVVAGASAKARELLHMTALDTLWALYDTREEAIAALSLEDVAQASCPVSGCDGWTSPFPFASLPSAEEQTCSRCGTRFAFSLTSGAGELAGLVSSLSIPTYEQEYIRLEIQDTITLQVVGRLDVFAFEALTKTWRTCPSPRRVLLDLSQTTEVSRRAAEELRALVLADRDSRLAILLDSTRIESAPLAGLPLFATRTEAQTFLGGSPSETKQAITVTIRPVGE